MIAARPRRRRTASRVTTAGVALAVLAVAAGALVLGIVAPRGIPGRSYYYVNAEFADAANLSPFSEVRVAGRRVGQVIEVAYREETAVARLQLDGDAGPLPADSTARIRLKGLLGQKFIEVTPGGGERALPENGTLPTRQTSTTVELDDILQTLDRDRRAELQTTLGVLGEGFLGRGADLNEMFRLAPDVAGDLIRVSDAVLARDGAAARLFPSAESAAAAFDPVRDALARGFDPQARALQPLSDRRAAVQDTLEVAPGVLTELRRGLDATVPLLEETTRMAQATSRITRPAPDAFRAATELLRASERSLRRTGPLLEQAHAAIPPTLSFLSRVDPVIDPSIRSLYSNVPPFTEIGRRRCDVLSTLGALYSSMSLGQPGGGEVGPLNLWRFEEGSETTANPTDPYPEPCTAHGQKAPPAVPTP